MIFVLDTNILIHIIRQTPVVQEWLNRIGVFNRKSYISISYVSIAEVKAFAHRNRWGALKMTALNILVSGFNPIAIDNFEIVDAYVEIDLYSQGKHWSHPLLSGSSSRTMGKNDIWIAATAYFLDATLITTDNDFSHLNSVFFDIEKIIIPPLVSF